MPSASDPRQPNRQGQPAPRPVQAGQRSVQPMPRPAQPSSHAVRPAQRATQQPTARTAQPAGGTRFKQQAPTQRMQAPNRIRITLVVRMALLRRPARATTRMLVAVLKRKAPRCL